MSDPVKTFVKDGRMAVLVSPGFGAGWSTWAREYGEAFAIDSELVEAFLAGGPDAVVKVAEGRYPDAYLGGARDLEIRWVPVGEAYEIEEYDGSESLRLIGEQSFWVAR